MQRLTLTLDGYLSRSWSRSRNDLKFKKHMMRLWIKLRRIPKIQGRFFNEIITFIYRKIQKI